MLNDTRLKEKAKGLLRGILYMKYGLRNLKDTLFSLMISASNFAELVLLDQYLDDTTR